MSELKLNLQKPLCFFDLETTGLNIGKDRMVEIAVIKALPDGGEEQLHLYIDPEMEIPAESSAIHGLTRERLLELGAQPLERVAKQIVDFIGDSDLAGYNSNKFDIPFLVEELKRVGLNLNAHNRLSIDVQNIFHKMEARTLKAAYKFYVNDDRYDRPHSAMDDTRATVRVLKAQIERYQGVEYEDKSGRKTTPIVNDVKALADFSTVRKSADLAGRIGYDAEGQEILTFGQNKGKRLREFLATDAGKGYFRWMMEADFAEDTKEVLKRINNEVKEQVRTEEKLALLKAKFASGELF